MIKKSNWLNLKKKIEKEQPNTSNKIKFHKKK